MTLNDPFADAPDEAQAEASPAGGSGTVQVSGNRVSVTFKGQDYDAAWIAVHTGSTDEALEILGGKADDDSPASVLKALMDRAASLGRYFSKKQTDLKGGNGASSGGSRSSGNSSNGSSSSSGSSSNGGGRRQAGRPANSHESPDGDTRDCDHGQMVYRTGVTKSGKNKGQTWRAFMCPSRDDDDKCEPEWL